MPTTLSFPRHADRPAAVIAREHPAAYAAVPEGELAPLVEAFRAAERAMADALEAAPWPPGLARSRPAPAGSSTATSARMPRP
jgi:hypothetical protein